MHIPELIHLVFNRNQVQQTLVYTSPAPCKKNCIHKKTGVKQEKKILQAFIPPIFFIHEDIEGGAINNTRENELRINAYPL